jgi:hypothetical protein
MHSDMTQSGEAEEPRDPAIAERLRRLPNELPPPFGFAELQRRARLQGHSLQARRLHLRAWVQRGVAAAAAFAVVTLAAAVWMRQRALDRPWAQSPPVAASTPAAEAEPKDARAADALSAGERWLASLPADPAIVRVDTRLGVTDLEDRIASVDDLLTAARVQRAVGSHLQTLQRERAELVASLVQVRYAETLAAAP